MQREEFDAYVGKLEKIARANPRLYVMRIIGLILVAYGFLLLVLLGSLALCGVMLAMVIFMPVTAKFAIFGLIAFGGVFLAIISGIWVRTEQPKGHVVTREQFPKLFSLLDELRIALNCKPFHKVLVVADMNAAVVQTPRLGMFGWYQNCLLLGLPLMQSLSSEEFKAVLVHEFAHSARGHGRFGNWLYRIRRTWSQIFERMFKRPTRFGIVLFHFIKWYWPKFNGHAFVLSRANEYEADAWSVRLAGADHAATALRRIQLFSALLDEKFWPDIFARANHEPMPPDNVMQAASMVLKTGPSAEESARWTRYAWFAETNNQDTHPCLKDRLRAINQLPTLNGPAEFPPAPPPFTSQNAAEFFLERGHDSLVRSVSDQWEKMMIPQWRTRHGQAKRLVDDLAAMEKNPPATAAQLWEKAKKIIELNGDKDAVATLEQIIAIEPKHAGANFTLGRNFLRADDARGVEFMEKAMATDPDCKEAGLNLLHAFFVRTCKRDQLRPLENRYDRIALSQHGRIEIFVSDVFIFHELEEDKLGALQKVFESEADIDSVAIVKKEFSFDANILCYVVCLKFKGWLKRRDAAEQKALLDRVYDQLGLPGHVFMLLAKEHRELCGNVFAAPGAVIYKRKK